MAENLSLIDITNVYKTMVQVAVNDLNDVKKEIGTKEATAQQLIDFHVAVNNFEMVNNATTKAMGSLTDTFKAMLRTQ
ncbi:MAG TPA: hypothetical protein VGN04_12145 [Herbaspirillum sp.]|jgi:hypothetical protein